LPGLFMHSSSDGSVTVLRSVLSVAAMRIPPSNGCFNQLLSSYPSGATSVPPSLILPRPVGGNPPPP
jgi:hypothetical protein